MRDQGELLAKIVGEGPKLLAVPIGLFDGIINGIQWLADLRAREGRLHPEAARAAYDAASHASARPARSRASDDVEAHPPRSKYYASRYATTDPSRSTARRRSRSYRKIAVEEYDPYHALRVEEAA